MKLGRNDPCPCGSGKKFKSCCQGNSDSPDRAKPLSDGINREKLIGLFFEGRYQDLERSLNALLKNDSTSPFLWGLLGATQQSQGKNGLVALNKAVQLSPNDSDALCNLASALHNEGQTAEAEKYYRQAICVRNSNIQAHINLGNLLLQNSDFIQAESSFKQAILLDPSRADALLGFGNALEGSKQFIQAEQNFRRAIKLQPAYADAYFCLGNLFRQTGNLKEAESNYLECLRIEKNAPLLLNNLGCIKLEQGYFDQAFSFFQQAIRLDPAFSEAHSNLGLVCVEKRRYSDAERCFVTAIRITPERHDLYGKLALVLKEQGRVKEAEKAYSDQLQANPLALEARIALTMLTLPIVSHDVKESLDAPQNFREALAQLSTWITTNHEIAANATDAVGSQQPYHLAYRDGNHLQSLSLYGSLMQKCSLPSHPVLPRSQGADKVRLSIISEHIRRHSVWDIVLRGLLSRLDRTRFHITLYHTGTQHDEETRHAMTLVDSWQDRSSLPHFDNLLNAVETDTPDVIFFPEIGMDPLSFRLAARRIAPLQIASWGHPITTGLDTIDLYFSGELLEAENAQEHYIERLVKLPGTGCLTLPLEIHPEPLGKKIQQLLESRSGVRFVIAQRAFKFDPVHYPLYAEIAARTKNCTFILLQDPVYPWASDIVRTGMEDALRAQGLTAENHLLDIPWVSPGQFLELLDACDIFLDCPAFSGYTTAWQAAHRGLPIVTLEGAYLRQRLAAGLLKKIDMQDTIARSSREYVDIAARLALEASDRESFRRKRETIRLVAATADNDDRVVRAFEQVIASELAALNNKRSAFE